MKTIAMEMARLGFNGEIELEVVKAAAEIAGLEIVSIDTNLICKINDLYSSEEGYTDFVVSSDTALVVSEENGYEREGMIVPISRVRELQRWENEGYNRLINR